MSEATARQLPTSELDLNLMLTNSVWGRPEVNQELKDRLTKFYVARDETGEVLKNEKGDIEVTKASLWGLLGFYTRDMRLANLSVWDGEMALCRYMIDLANDYLASNMVEPFIISLSRAVTIMETSQSKGGFLRKNMNTLRQKTSHENLEPPKKGFFGKGNKQEGGY